jgi:hypothetical protein
LEAIVKILETSRGTLLIPIGSDDLIPPVGEKSWTVVAARNLEYLFCGTHDLQKGTTDITLEFRKGGLEPSELAGATRPYTETLESVLTEVSRLARNGRRWDSLAANLKESSEKEKSYGRPPLVG